MQTDGGGWTLAFVKNSAHAGAYPTFGSGYVNLAALAGTPEAASASSTALAGWLDLNQFSYSTLRLAVYANGTRNYISNSIARSSLRLQFGHSGYYLYGDTNGYYWCAGAASFTDSGVGQVNPPPGAPSDCKGHVSLGSGWDFSTTLAPNLGLTMCGNDAGSNFIYGNYGGGRLYYYPSTGAAQAIWVR